MAWLQNLAGKAEDLLDRIDKNAASVLSESNIKPHIQSDESSLLYTEIVPTKDDILLDTDVAIVGKDLTTGSQPPGFSDNISIISDKSELSDIDDEGISFHFKQDSLSPTHNSKQEPKSELGGPQSTSTSLRNSFNSLDEFPYNVEEKITKLKHENESLNQQLTDIRHMFTELQNENSNLQSELDKTSIAASTMDFEMQRYRARARRLLHEKEELIALRNGKAICETTSNEYTAITCNEVLREHIVFNIETDLLWEHLEES